MAVEYRICWSASTNISFTGKTDWQEWWGDESDSEDIVHDTLGAGKMEVEGLGEALEASGFDWWVEVREADRS